MKDLFKCYISISVLLLSCNLHRFDERVVLINDLNKDILVCYYLNKNYIGEKEDCFNMMKKGDSIRLFFDKINLDNYGDKDTVYIEIKTMSLSPTRLLKYSVNTLRNTEWKINIK